MRWLRFALLMVVVFAPRAFFSQDNAAQATRGKYLVENVGLCQECHTPKTDSGELDHAKWMKGATLDFAPIGTIPKWHKTSPDLTPSGSLWKRWGPDGIVKFMETGKNPRGGGADPPMPAYRLNHEDAVAVVEYLRTLK